MRIAWSTIPRISAPIVLDPARGSETRAAYSQFRANCESQSGPEKAFTDFLLKKVFESYRVLYVHDGADYGVFDRMLPLVCVVPGDLVMLQDYRAATTVPQNFLGILGEYGLRSALWTREMFESTVSGNTTSILVVGIGSVLKNDFWRACWARGQCHAAGGGDEEVVLGASVSTPAPVDGSRVVKPLLDPLAPTVLFARAAFRTRKGPFFSQIRKLTGATTGARPGGTVRKLHLLISNFDALAKHWPKFGPLRRQLRSLLDRYEVGVRLQGDEVHAAETKQFRTSIDASGKLLSAGMDAAAGTSEESSGTTGAPAAAPANRLHAALLRETLKTFQTMKIFPDSVFPNVLPVLRWADVVVGGSDEPSRAALAFPTTATVNVDDLVEDEDLRTVVKDAVDGHAEGEDKNERDEVWRERFGCVDGFENLRYWMGVYARLGEPMLQKLGNDRAEEIGGRGSGANKTGPSNYLYWQDVTLAMLREK